MRRETGIVAAALASICLIILGSSLFCTWAIAAGSSPRWRLLFRVLCHGLPSRSFELWGTAMPICARCVGIYAGLLAATALFAMIPEIQPRILRLALLIAAAPLAIDGLTQAAGFRESTNALRVGTGIAAAFAFGLWVLNELERAANRRSDVT